MAVDRPSFTIIEQQQGCSPPAPLYTTTGMTESCQWLLRWCRPIYRRVTSCWPIPLEQVNNFPHHTVATTLRSDLVIWSDQEKALYLVELTICYKTGFVEAECRKTARYAELVAKAQKVGYRSMLTPLQVGNKGDLEERGPLSLHSIVPEASSRQWKAS